MGRSVSMRAASLIAAVAILGGVAGQVQEQAFDSSTVENCVVSGFEPVELNGGYRPINPGIWEAGVGGIFIFYERLNGCWVIDYEFWVGNSGKYSKNEAATREWPARRCGDITPTPPELGWMGNRGPEGSFVQTGRVTCSFDPLPRPTAEQFQKAIDRQNRERAGLQPELVIVILLIMMFWATLIACRIRAARQYQMNRVRMLQNGEMWNPHPHSLSHVEISVIPDAAAPSGGGGAGGQGVAMVNAQSRREWPPVYLAKEAVAMLQSKSAGEIVLKTPPRSPAEIPPWESRESWPTYTIRWSWTPAYQQQREKEAQGIAAPSQPSNPPNTSSAPPAEGEGETCCICLEVVPDVKVMQCGHQSQCRTCFMQQLIESKQPNAPFCPICRANVESVILDVVPPRLPRGPQDSISVHPGSRIEQSVGGGFGRMFADMVFSVNSRDTPRQGQQQGQASTGQNGSAFAPPPTGAHDFSQPPRSVQLRGQPQGGGQPQAQAYRMPQPQGQQQQGQQGYSQAQGQQVMYPQAQAQAQGQGQGQQGMYPQGQAQAQGQGQGQQGMYPQGQDQGQQRRASQTQPPPAQSYSLGQQGQQMPQQATQYPRPSTEMPQQSNQYPRRSTEVPVQASQYPQASVQMPRQSTQYPRRLMEGPQQSSQYPQQSTQVPEQSTRYPRRPIQMPQQSTQIPQQSTQIPQQSTQIPQQSTQIPQQSTRYPRRPIQIPQQSTQIPQQSTQMPQQSTQIPQQNASSPPAQMQPAQLPSQAEPAAPVPGSTFSL